jgi:hypothetical protein
MAVGHEGIIRTEGAEGVEGVEGRNEDPRARKREWQQGLPDVEGSTRPWEGKTDRARRRRTAARPDGQADIARTTRWARWAMDS